MRTVTLNKQDHRFVFRYNEANQCDILEAVADLASDPGSDFDWVDAASVSFQIASEQAAKCLKTLTPAE